MRRATSEAMSFEWQEHPEDGHHEGGQQPLQEGTVRECELYCPLQPVQEVQEAPVKTGRPGFGCQRLCGQGNGEDKEEVHQPQGERKGYECSKG